MQVAAWMVAMVAALAAAGTFAKWLWLWFRRASRLTDEWFGEPAHNGHPAVPGMPARLDAIESYLQQMATGEQIAQLTAAWHTLDERMAHIEDRMTAVEAQFDRLQPSSLEV